jgi:tetratricopeptide (TPR) repeat protein
MSPADRDLFERLHELLSNSDQVSRFFTHLRAVVDRRQGDDRSRCDILCWAAGVRLETGGNDAHGEAAELLEMALEVCPDNLEAWKRLCDLYEEGEPEQLVSCLERVVELEEGELVGKTKIKLAEAHLERLDQPQLAADILEGEARGSKDEDVLSLYARALIRADRLQEAEDVLGRLAALADEAWSPCVEAADLAARRQDPVAERGWLLEAIEHGGPGLELSRRLVRLERKTGDRRHWARALESLLDYEQEPERRAEAIGELARVVLSDSPDRSLELLREAVSLVPEDVSIRRQLAEAAMKREELELAIEVLADLHQSLGGDEPDVRGDISVQMADAMAGMGEDPDAARDLYRRAADEFVDGERRAHALGRTAELARQTSSPGLEEEALRALEEAFDEREGSGGDDCVEIRLRLVELCLERGAWGEAVALCDKLSEAGVSSPSLRKHRAAALEALGRWAEAADSWVEAAGEEPDVDFLLRAASLRRDRLEDPEGALELLGRALTKDPTDTDVMSQIESLCRQHERWEELVELKELSLQGRADQERARILHAMAVIRERKLADPDGAATLLARAHSLDPDFWPVLRPLGEYHFQNREWEPARDYFRRALDAEQASAEAKVEILDRLARIERAESEWRAEIDYLRQAVELDPDRDELWNRAEEVLRRGDDRQGLFDLLARRAELSPGGQKAKRLFEAARLMDQEMGQPDRAIALYERAIEINPEALEPRQRLLELLRERGQWHALADRLQAELLLVEGPAKAQIADELASLYESKADDHVAAERCYRLAYREEPTNPKRIRSLADHLARQRRWEDLADFLEMSLDTVGLPDAAFSGFTALLGRTYLEKLGKSDKARDVFERARSRRALTSRSVELLSKIYWEKGLYDELASLLRQELKQMEDGARRYQLVAKLADLLEGKVGDQIGAADLRVQLYEVRPRRHRKHAERACELYLEHSRYEEAERLAADLAETADEDEKPEAELRWGLILLDYLGREEEAFEVLSRVIEARPDLARAHLALGRILFTRGQLDQALFHLEIVAAGEVQDKELSAEAHQLAGAAAEELKRPEDAQRHLEAAFEQDPTNDGVLRSLDRLYTATGQLDKLARVLGREIDVEADPEARAKLWYRRALLHRDILDDMPEAVRCLREAVGAAPHFVEAVSTLRQACAHTGDWALAAQLVDREIAVEQDPERLAELYVARGKLLEDKLHQPKRAQDAYAKAAELDPVNPKPVDELARLLALTGESSEAARATEKLVERQAGVKRGETFLRAAKLYLRGGEQSEAWRCWKEVLSDDDEESWLEASQAMSSSARSEAQSREMAELLEGCMGKASRDEVRVELLRHLIRLLVELDEPERAEPFAAELLRRVPADRTAFLHKRKMVEKRGELTQLRSLLEQRLEVAGSEEMVDLLFALGNLQYRELEDSEAAAATFDRLLEQDPGNKGALDARADIAYHTGDYPLAYELYESLGDDVSMLAADEKHARRGDIAEALGIDEEAIAHYERAVDTNPTNRGAWEALCRIHLFSERYERAVPALKKLTELVPVAEVDTTLEVRTQLVKALVYLGRIEEAERYLDKLRHLLAQDTVELRKLSLEVHQKLGRWEDAAADLDALVRLVDDPKLKAQILFREGELRLSQLDDAEGAADCYLKGADLDPAHLPTNRRLSEHYACEGDWKQLVEVCETLVENEPSDSNRAAAVARLAVGLVLEGGSEALQAPELLAKIDDGQLDPRHAVRILSDVSIGLKKKGFTMAPMSRVLDTLSSALGGETLESWLDEAVGLLAEKPADTGARRLVSRLSARLAKRSLGSQHAKVLRFVDPSDSAAMDGKAEGRSRGMVSNALDVDGPALPEDLRVPLRQALVALSAKLHGFGRTRPPGLDELASLHDGVSPLMAARIGSLLTRLRVSGVEVLIEEGEQVSVRAVDARPPVVVATTGACALGEEELVFLLARELEWVRSGSLFLRGRSGSDEEALCGALASLLGAEVEDDEISRLADELADWAEIPFSLDDASHDALRSAMTHHMKSPVDIGAYLKAEVRMAQRIGLLSCEDLGSALRAACAQVGGASALDEKNVAVREKLLASDPAIAELARFGVSGKYVKLMRRSTMSGY